MNRKTIISISAVFLVMPALAQTERVLYSFEGTPDGAYPNGGLIADANGTLYGTTVSGGTPGTSASGLGCGVVFELKRSASGVSESVIWTFQSDSAADGCEPYASLVFDS